MPKNTLPIKLVSSDHMTKMSNVANEDNYIRLPKATRELLEIEIGDKISLGYEEIELRLFEVNFAYVEDATTAKDNKKKHLGFITNRVYKFFNVENKDMWIKKHKVPPIITVGADPEFLLLVNNDTIQYAGSLFSEKDCFTKYSPIGCDGPCAEIRPTFSSNPNEVCKSIRKHIKAYADTDLLIKFKWKPGAYMEGNILGDMRSKFRRLGIGGHIHLGLPSYLQEKLSKASLPNQNLYLRNIATTLTKLLDHFIAVPLLKLEGNEVLKRRGLGSDYGKAGSYRVKNDHFEWRTLSGIWLVDPKYAEGVMTLSQQVAIWAYLNLFPEKEAITTSIKNLNSRVEILVDKQKLMESELIINNKNPEDIKRADCLDRFKNLLSVCSNEGMSCIEPIFNLERVDFAKKEDLDLREIWG